MRDSYLGKKGSARDRKGILQVQSGRGVESRGWTRQRLGERNSVYVVTRDSLQIHSPVAIPTIANRSTVHRSQGTGLGVHDIACKVLENRVSTHLCSTDGW